MDLTGKVSVVTGAASGIGFALASAFAAAGSTAVVVADVDEAAAEKAAVAIGGPATGVGCDVSREQSVRDLIADAEERFGAVDVFVANAGIGSGRGLDADDDEWRRVLDVNLWGHIYAARILVPRWLERGEGYYVATASAAGLLTQIGDAPYAVSKHACVAFAEWLAVTYGARGVRVSCLCPMGVDTPMLRDGLGGRGDDDLGTRVVAAVGGVMQPQEVATQVIEALREERFLVLPHPEVLEFTGRKVGDYDGWIEGMQRLQAQVERTTSGSVE